MKINEDKVEERYLTEKEKKAAKTVVTSVGIILLFSFYKELWKSGNTKQRLRMASTWILFLVTVNVNPSNLRYFDGSFTGSYDSFLERQKLYETLFPLIGICWLSLVIYSWYKRSKENKENIDHTE